jgi:hypothetical protein
VKISEFLLEGVIKIDPDAFMVFGEIKDAKEE